MNESYDISTGSYLKEEQGAVFDKYFPNGCEPDKALLRRQMLFHKKWASHEFDSITLLAQERIQALMIFFEVQENKFVHINFSTAKYPFVRIGDRVLCIPYVYMDNLQKLSSEICDELLPLLFLLEYLPDTVDFQEKVSDFFWREKVGKIF